MKVCILSAVNIKHMSLISLYTDILKKNKIDYDIIYMDKYDDDEEFECSKKYRYVNVIKRDWPKPFKALKYMTFLKYATKILNKENYDFVIVWNDVAIFMFSHYLPKKYKGKYCLNVRDNMKYDQKWTQKMYAREFANAAFCTTSSVGYLDFLPRGIEYLPIHSLNLSALNGMNKHCCIRKLGEPIRIGFIGYVRYFERNKKILDLFANDERFEVHYYGTGANILKTYADEKNINNTVFHDSFPVADTKKYLENIDVINNLYGNDDINLKKAISIRFFHALYSKIPILVCKDTYISEVAQNIGVGFEVDEIDDKMKEDFYDWYRKLNFEKLSSSCDKYLENAVQENKNLEEVLMRCLYSEQHENEVESEK